ncbi:MAG: rRNA maturation RNase YbeY [Microgenomates group bacterium]
MFSINLVFVDRKTIRALNKKYRRVDKPTTVLSFYYSAPTLALAKGGGPTSPRSFGASRDLGQANFPLGEVLICPEEAKKQKLKIEDLVAHGLSNILSQIPATEARRIGLGGSQPRVVKNR